MKTYFGFCMSIKKFSIITILIFFGFLSGFFVNMYEIYPYSDIKQLYSENQRVISEIEIYEDDITSLIHINDLTSKIRIQNDLVNFIWKQNTLPKNEPSKLEKNIISQQYVDMENLDSIDKLTIDMEYGVNSIAYFFKPTVSNDKLVIYHQGHRGDFFEGKQTIEYFLEKNYSVIALSMPLLGMNSQPIIDHPEFGKIKFESHNQFELLENENFTPIKFFVEPTIIVINYLENNYDFNSYYMIGISGGGWITTLIPAIDDRITKNQ